MSCGTGNLASKILTQATGFNDLEKARRGWELRDILNEEDTYFTDRCELCNQPGLHKNFIIEHENTHYRLRVGSRCILKFVLLKGTENHQDSNRYFERKSNELYAVKTIGQLLAEITGQAIVYSTVYQFRKKCAAILGCSISDIKAVCFNSKNGWDKLIKTLNDTMPDGKLSTEQLDRVRLALFDPRKLPLIKKKIRKDKYEGFQKKRTRAITTLSKSSAYENPENKYR